MMFGLKSTWSAQSIFTEPGMSVRVRFEGEILKGKNRTADEGQHKLV